MAEETTFFDGTNGAKECTEFVRSIGSHAFARGKMGDDEWMAKYAITRITGAAVIWLYSLDEEVQSSWKLLRRALLEQYAASAPKSSQIIPTPAAAASGPPRGISQPSVATPRNTSRLGVLKLLGTSSEVDLYISRQSGLNPGIPSLLQTTTSRYEALQVSYLTSGAGSSDSSQRKHISVPNTDYCLGLVWKDVVPDLKRGSTSHMGLAVARAQNNGLTTYHDKLWGWSTVPNPGQWRIAPDGEVTAEFEAIDGKVCVLETGSPIFWFGPPEYNVYFFVDFNGFQASHFFNAAIRCRLMFESI